MDEHHRSALREHKVGEGQSPHMKSISKTLAKRRERSIRSGWVFFPRMLDIMRLRCGVVGTRMVLGINFRLNVCRNGGSRVCTGNANG